MLFYIKKKNNNWTLKLNLNVTVEAVDLCFCLVLKTSTREKPFRRHPNPNHFGENTHARTRACRSCQVSERKKKRHTYSASQRQSKPGCREPESFCRWRSLDAAVFSAPLAAHAGLCAFAVTDTFSSTPRSLTEHGDTHVYVCLILPQIPWASRPTIAAVRPQQQQQQQQSVPARCAAPSDPSASCRSRPGWE